MSWSDVSGGSTDIVKAYYLTFTPSSSNLSSGAIEEMQVSGLVGSQSIKLGPLDETNDTADLAGWKDSGSGSPSGSGDNSMSPYRVPNASPYTVSFSASSGAFDKYIESFNNSGSMVTTRLAVYDSSDTLIGISGQITVQTQ